MLKNYVNIAIRSILKHRVFSFINIFGLAVAMSICMGIIMLVADQMMVDRHNANSERIYRITSVPYWAERNGEPGNEFSTTTLPIRDELINNYTGIEKAVRIMRGFGNGWLEIEPGNDVNVPVSGFFADPELLDIFQHELQYGDKATALVEPYSVVLTKKAAEKLFKAENPVGESLKVGKLGVFKITGVIKETENRSHIVAEAFASMSTVKSLVAAKIIEVDNLNNWYSFHHGWVYLQLEEGKTPEDIKPHLEKISHAHFTNMPPPNTTVVKYNLQGLLDIVPGPLLNNPIGPFMPWFLIYCLSGLAGIVLITSCFNFTNLSIARSLTRAREIGVRKVTGATRGQLFVQFLSESVIISLFAMVLAIIIIYALRPFIVDLAFARFLKWNLSANYVVYAVFFCLAIVVGIIAGLFPAGVLSGFQPIKVLKDLGNTKLMSKLGMRKALLVAQFSLSMIFILTVIVLYKQMNLYLHNDNGFTTENKLIIQKGDTSVEAFKTELSKQSNIVSVSAASHIPMAGISYGDAFRSPDQKEWTDLEYYAVDENYLENMGLTLVAGKFFSAENGMSNSNFIVLNEHALTTYQLGSPAEAIGKTLIIENDSTERQVIGVVKSYHYELLGERLEPLGLTYSPEEFSMFQVVYKGDFKEASRTVEHVWAKINPGVKSEIKDFRKEMGEMYDIIFGTLVKVLGFIAFLAITISCLGLLGMATYSIETRKKEIAMRKILGSSNRSLVYVLSKGYIMILLLALLISVPIAYYMNTIWLEGLAYHVTVDFVTIALGVFVLAFFGLFTVGSQTIQATMVNPVDNLKND